MTNIEVKKEKEERRKELREARRDKWRRWLKARQAEIIEDATLLVALILIGVGCWWQSPAWALIVVGLILLYLVLFFRGRK